MFDFGVGYSEMFVLAVVAIIVIGPKDLPKVLRTFGQFMRKARGMAREFQGHVDAAMKDAGVDGIKKDVMDMRKSIGSAVGAPAAPVTPAPKFPGNSVYAASSASRDFESHFDVSSQSGETRVAGVLHVEANSAT